MIYDDMDMDVENNVAESHLLTSGSVCSLKSKQRQGGVQLLVFDLIIRVTMMMIIDQVNRLITMTAG